MGQKSSITFFLVCLVIGAILLGFSAYIEKHRYPFEHEGSEFLAGEHSELEAFPEKREHKEFKESAEQLEGKW